MHSRRTGYIVVRQPNNRCRQAVIAAPVHVHITAKGCKMHPHVANRCASVCVCVCSGRGYLCLILVGIQKIYKYLCTPLAVALKQDPLWPLGKTVLSATPGGCATMFLSHLLSTANVESWTNKNVPQSRGFLKQDTWSQHKMFHLFTWTAPCYPCARRCSSFFVLQHPSVLSDRNVCFVVFSTVFVFSFFFSAFALLDFCLFRWRGKSGERHENCQYSAGQKERLSGGIK